MQASEIYKILETFVSEIARPRDFGHKQIKKYAENSAYFFEYL